MPKKLKTYLLFGYCLLSWAAACFAQATNGAYTLSQESITSAGGPVTGTYSANTSLGLAIGGKTTNGAYTLINPTGQPASAALPAPNPLTVTGTINDPSATVTVNGVTAAITDSTYTATGVTLPPGPNTLTVIAKDAAGNQASHFVHVYQEIPQHLKTPRFTCPVQGTIDDGQASIVVNGIAATKLSGTYRADVLLKNGVNTLTTLATDVAGNQTSSCVHVYVPLPVQLPALPTIAATPGVTTTLSASLSGTKTKGTSIWINGVEAVAQNDQLTWSVTRSLTEGDNEFTVITKNSSGFSSAAAWRNIIVDNQPPVITFAPGQPPVKTNLNPFPFQGNADDSGSVVKVNNLTTTRTGRGFQIPLNLVFGSNAVRVTATSPNGYVMVPKDYTIILGHMPVIQTVAPGDGTKLFIGTAVSFAISANDADQDPIQYRLLLGANPIGNWQTSATLVWTPAGTQSGLQPVSVEVKDDFGGSNKKDLETYVIHAPVQHP